MTSITRKKAQEAHEIHRLLISRLEYLQDTDPEGVADLLLGTAITATRMLTLSELKRWHIQLVKTYRADGMSLDMDKYSMFNERYTVLYPDEPL